MTFTPRNSYKLVEKAITDEERGALSAWLMSDKADWLTQGPLVKEFEAAFAKEAGIKHAVFVNSGSSANLLAWFFPIAVDRETIAANRRAAVPAVAWSTSVAPAIQFGYEPVLIEADEETWGASPADLRRICEKHPPSVVLVVHVLGVPAKMEELKELRDEFGFVLIEDACGAFGSHPVGAEGTDITTFSTYAGHQLSTIEGGFVCVNGDPGEVILKTLRAHGWANDVPTVAKTRLYEDWKVDPFRERFTFFLPGFNVRNTDLAAHIGLSQLAIAKETIAARRKNHALYFERFKDNPHFKVQKVVAGHEASPIAFGVLAESKEHRNKVADELYAKGIETRPIAAGNIARQPFWRLAYGEQKRERPLADRIHRCGFQLPLNPSLTEEDIGFIAETVTAIKP